MCVSVYIYIQDDIFMLVSVLLKVTFAHYPTLIFMHREYDLLLSVPTHGFLLKQNCVFLNLSTFYRVY